MLAYLAIKKNKKIFAEFTERMRRKREASAKFKFKKLKNFSASFKHF